MKVKELIENLKKYSEDMDVCVYTPCGPSVVKDTYLNAFGELILDCGEVCEHITDGKCTECESTDGKIWEFE